MAGEIIDKIAGNQYRVVPNGDPGDVPVQQADGTKAMQTARQSGSSSWRAEAGTGTPPSSGSQRWNNATQTSSTELYLSHTNADGTDGQVFLQAAKAGDAYWIQAQEDANHYQYFSITSVTNDTGFVRYGVTLISAQGGNFSTTGQGQKLIVSLRPDAGTLSGFSQSVQSLGDSPTFEVPEEDDAFIWYDEVDGDPHLGRVKDISGQQRIYVRTAADFGTIDSTKEYFIDGVIDMTGVTVEVPAGGINISGYNFDLSQLVCADNNYTMFQSAVGGSGNFLAKDVAMECSGTGSQVFDLTSLNGFQAFEYTRVNFNNCTSLGEITNYRQGFESGTGRFGGTPTLTLSGTWLGGYFIDSSIVRSLDAGMTTPLYSAGAGFTMNSRFRSNQNIDLPASAAFIDFAASNFPNPGTVQLTSMEVTRNGVYNADDSNLTPNIAKGDLASYWKSNNGLPNTFVGGTSNVSVEATTTVSAVDTWYTLAGTFLGTGLEHFSASTDGKLTHLGNSPREFEITADLSLESNANNVLSVRFNKWDDSASAFTPLDYTIRARQVNSLVGGRDVVYFTLIFGGILDQNDYLQLQVQNNSGTANITMETSSFFRVQER